MNWIHRLRRRVRALFSKPDVDREMNEEMRLHLALETEDLMRAGLAHDEAARRAHIAFGGVERHKEETRDARGVRSIEDRIRDLAYIVRSLRRAPAFTFAVIFSLALGIGANSTMFTIISAVLLRPLPYADAGELLGVESSTKGVVQESLPEPYFNSWARENHTLASIALYAPTFATVAGHAPPERVDGSRVSAGLFGLIEAHPSLGRFFTSSDEATGAAPVMIISDALWRRHFGGDSSIIGRTVELDDKPVTVIGVMRRGLEFPQHADFWTPWKSPSTATAIFWVDVVARQRKGVPLVDVQRELSQIARSADRELPKFLAGTEFVVTPLHDRLFGSARPALELLFAAVALLLLIACANVANLVLARATQRQREFAVRDRKSTRLNSSHYALSRMPSSA